MRILLGKINDSSLKKQKKYKTFKSTQKLDLYVKKSGDFFESAPPPLDLPFRLRETRDPHNFQILALETRDPHNSSNMNV